MGRFFFAPHFQERVVLLSAVLLRILVGLSSYSGAGDAPKFGDYEAQRHWMEITTNSPPNTWYTESEFNNITYWPLDYPPLSGYQSWVHGQVIKHFEPAAVELFTSHGYETPSSKVLMRLTVLGSDLLIFFPAAIAAARMLYGPRPSMRRAMALGATLLNPALILVDHGHFQYNCISLGLAIGAAAAVGSGSHLLGSFLFCCSLNHKQMSLFFAPAFFAHLLGKCFAKRGFFSKIGGILQLGVVVILSFGLMWAPWLTGTDSVMQVVHRIFPLRRGLFEDYVANWWCVSSVVIKWKQLIPADGLVGVCAGCTLLACLPSMLHQMWRPSSRGLVVSMANTGMAFFMLAYQVHEKSVLLPLTPVLLLAGDHPITAAWMPPIAMVSMFPLLERDGLTLPYVGLACVWLGLMAMWAPAVLTHLRSASTGYGSDAGRMGGGQKQGGGWAVGLAKLLGVLFLIAAIGLHVAKHVVAPPENLPWLYDRAFVTLAFGGLALIMLYMQLVQWSLQPQLTYRWDEQEQTMHKKKM